jgi:hypothetical protein
MVRQVARSGYASTIDIRWPSGILQHFDHIKADQFLRVDEPLRSAARPAGQEDAVEPLSSKIASVAGH